MKTQYFKFEFTAEAETITEVMSHFNIAIGQLKLLEERKAVSDTKGRGETKNGSYFYSLRDLAKEDCQVIKIPNDGGRS